MLLIKLLDLFVLSFLGDIELPGTLKTGFGILDDHCTISKLLKVGLLCSRALEKLGVDMLTLLLILATSGFGICRAFKSRRRSFIELGKPDSASWAFNQGLKNNQNDEVLLDLSLIHI